jgi:hypothetical protein
MSANQPIIHVMISYPEPEHSTRYLNRQGAMMETDARGQEAPRFLQSQGRVLGIILQEFERFIGEFPNRRLQWRGPVIHNSVDRCSE